MSPTQNPSPPTAVPSQTQRLGAALFDAYGTLFDVYSVAQLAEQLFPGHGTAISLVWRDKQIEYTRICTTSNHGAHYRPFSELTRAALVYAVKKAGASAAEAASGLIWAASGIWMPALANWLRSTTTFLPIRKTARCCRPSRRAASRPAF